jgi:hypothetical protein
VHRSFTISVAASRDAKTHLRISRDDSLKKLVLASGDEAQSRCGRKFFYCQKTRLRVVATCFRPASVSHDNICGASIAQYESYENTCGTVVSCKLTIVGAGFSRVTRIVACKHCGAADEPAPRVRASARQHFLKRDTVFSTLLVYSGCSASRFPSARSDKAISLHQEGNMAKKAKKAKKAKSAVKKTAKKTRKVAKKKK